MMNRMFCFFAALLFALAFTPAVGAAKIWDLLPYNQPNVKVFTPDRGDTILMVQRNMKLAAGYWISGKIKIPAGCLVIYNTGNIIGRSDSLWAGEPIPARPVRMLGTDDPEAKKILAALGFKEYWGSDRDGTGWRIRGGYARFTNVEARGVDSPFIPDGGGADLRICDSRISAMLPIGVYELEDRNDIAPMYIQTARVVFETVGNTEALWLDLRARVFYTDTTSVLDKQVVVTGNATSAGRAIFVGTKGLQFSNRTTFAADAQRMGFIIVQPPKSALIGDFDNSGLVDFDDFFLFAAAFGQPATGDNAKFDLTPNGQIDFDDFFLFAVAFSPKAGKPIALLGNSYPNPCNPATTVQYGLAGDALVSLRVYNILGQVVRTLVNERQTMGVYSIRWDGRDETGRPTASGVYIYRLDTSVLSNTRKVTLLK